MLDALLATIGTLGILASLILKLRAPRTDAKARGSTLDDAAAARARVLAPGCCPRRHLCKRRR